MSEAPKRVWVAKQRSTGLSVIDEYPAKCPYAFDEFVSAAALRDAIDRNATAHDIVDAIETLLEGKE